MPIEDFERFATGADFMSATVQGWLQKLGLRQNIDLQQELTSVASGDEVGIFDVSETGQVKYKKATIGNLLAAGIAAAFSTLTVTGLLTLTGGQIKFPATQNPSSDANTLDDYEEGTWTVVFTCETPGDLSVSYSGRSGKYTRIGDATAISFSLATSSFTWSTSSGNVYVTGIPFVAAYEGYSTLRASGWTNATYTYVVAQINAGDNKFRFNQCASGVARAVMQISSVPSGGSVDFTTSLIYFV